jgi:quercetin dioxygenase-like cupin family protein
MAEHSGKGKFIEFDECEKLQVAGLTQVIKVSSEDTNGAFTLVDDTLVPNFRCPLHLHRSTDETFTILSGSAEFQVGTEKRMGLPGMTIHVPRGIQHAVESGGEGLNMITQFTPGGLEGMSRELSALMTSSEAPTAEKLEEVAERYDTTFLEPFPI